MSNRFKGWNATIVGTCQICEVTSPVISDALGLCPDCISGIRSKHVKLPLVCIRNLEKGGRCLVRLPAIRKASSVICVWTNVASQRENADTVVWDTMRTAKWMVSVLSGEIYPGIMIRCLPIALGIGSVRVIRDVVLHSMPIVRDRNTALKTWQFRDQTHQYSESFRCLVGNRLYRWPGQLLVYCNGSPKC